MANIKLSLETDLSDEVAKKFIEILEKTNTPPEEIHIELSEIRGHITVRLVPAKTEVTSGEKTG